MITFESIRRVFEEERMYKKKLVNIDENFFKDVFQYLEKRENIINDKEMWEVQAIRKRIENIIEMRIRKILDMALNYVHHKVFPENMITIEKEFFMEIVKNIERFEKYLRSKESKELSLIIIKDNVDKFLDEDMKIYGPLNACDIVLVSKNIADILVKNNKAEFV